MSQPWQNPPTSLHLLQVLGGAKNAMEQKMDVEQKMEQKNKCGTKSETKNKSGTKNAMSQPWQHPPTSLHLLQVLGGAKNTMEQKMDVEQKNKCGNVEQKVKQKTNVEQKQKQMWNKK